MPKSSKLTEQAGRIADTKALQKKGLPPREPPAQTSPQGDNNQNAPQS